MFHVRALTDAGFTVSQLTVNFPTADAAQKAADKANRFNDDEGVEFKVCVSLDHSDPRNKTNPETKTKPGFLVYEPESDADSEAAPKVAAPVAPKVATKKKK